ADGKHVLYAGPDADRLAERFGLETCRNGALISDRARARRQPSGDTVGAVALDQHDNLASATSTGGISGKQPGRVGDSPIIGAGGYAGNESGAISATGSGEAIMRLVLARWTAERLLTGHTPQQAADAAAAYLKERLNGDGGLIVLDRAGGFGAARNTRRMPWGARSPAGEQLGS
ncbi:MAG: isoaspartyl peptidase/L-asparaginase, partial [Chloroflexi bacterium]|nr:isoaspartyl peptidase/L-asparaginase [Chloroflexota bacterium]